MGVRTTWRGGWGEDNLVNIQCRGHTWFGGLASLLATSPSLQTPGARIETTCPEEECSRRMGEGWCCS